MRSLPPGSIAGNYVLEQLIGRGGAGIVYLATRRTDQTRAAVKVLNRALAVVPAGVVRFLREVDAVNRIRHPNIIEVYDVGHLPDQRPYFAMELLEGTNLRNILNDVERLEPQKSLPIVEAVCGALDAAHAQGIVHRDVKAENVVVCRDGRIKLVDFGIAKLLEQDSSLPNLTRTGQFIGTPIAMAPEQIRGVGVDARADTYGLGILVYHILTGRPPFRGSWGEVVRFHIMTKPPAPSTLTPLAPAIDAAVLRCLEKDPAARFASSLEFFQAYRHAVMTAPPTPSHAARPSMISSSTSPVAASAPTPSPVGVPAPMPAGVMTAASTPASLAVRRMTPSKQIALALMLRPAVPHDIAELAESLTRANPGSGVAAVTHAERLRGESPWPLSTMSVAERGGAIAGHARTIHMRGWLAGRETRVGGLAELVVLPEARRTGVATALCEEHLASLKADGLPWSMAFAPSPGFLARHGWRPVAQKQRLRIPPRALPLAAERSRVSRLTLLPGSLAEVQTLYAEHCQRIHGGLSRSDAQLRAFLRDRDVLVGVRGPTGGLAGYLLYSMLAPPGRRPTIVVRELVTVDTLSDRALLGFLAAQADQADWIVLDLAVDHPLFNLVELRAQNEPAPGLELDPLPVLMARVIDLSGVLVGRGYPGGDGAVAIAAQDKAFPANQGALTIVVSDGTVRLQPGLRPGAPVLRGDIGEISRVLCGGIRLVDSARLGLLDVEGDVAAASTMLALPPPAPSVVF